ncbi:MAG: UDP-4-amino-4,6-dideoxy-N-acetyl-beta-L-altrosamine transaminase [Rhodospirillales bacterium]|nr:UDP-4-amino-4,6-dideoxy-N-acetyl-beta-L-altrosamine transaminase [Rhodospirillales bacterium]
MPDHLSFLPYGRQWIEDDDIAAVTQALRGDFLTTGPLVDKFEQAFAERVGARFAVVCTSGTAAQHLSTLAIKLKPQAKAIVPAVTFLSTANCARYVGAEVVFADVSPDTGLMEAEHLRLALATAKDARAVFPVHLAGQCADMQAIHDLARQNDLTIVEDACHAIGTTYETRDGETLGVGACAHSDMAVFSLHPVKTITMGEGGVITTNNPELATRLKRLRSHGMVRDASQFVNSDLALDGTGEANPWYYEMGEIGFNYRAPDINCALGLSQLAKLNRFIAARRALVESYDNRLAALAPLVKPLSRTQCSPGWHLYVVLIDFRAAGMERAELMAKLRERRIGSQVHYIPVHLQPYYRERYGSGPLPGAMAYYDRCLSLPLFPAMNDDDVDRVVAALADLLGK